MQGQIAGFCREYRLAAADCSRFARQTIEAVLEEEGLNEMNLPQRQFGSPTPEHPFVFLHHEKTAGSSLRRYIVQKALEMEQGFYVPCYDKDGTYWEDMRCYSFDLKNASALNGGEKGDLGVVAGHFDWDVWGGLDSFDGDVPPCLVMVRHPVDRAVSLYYERLYPREDFGGRKVNELEVEEWEWLLREFKGSAFSMYRDEGLCDTLCSTLLGRSLHRGVKPEDLQVEKIEMLKREGMDERKAMGHLDKCLVGLQDDWEGTKDMIWHWFPWLTFEDDVKVNTGMGKAAEKRQELRHEIRERLEGCNQCDMAVYEHAKERFALQKEFMRTKLS
ncbi:hypothetical protein TeGR_g3842 [Tetraparma gracilis]|uniref:Sulfotransferase n=1 Tax=Tetraparma gracilis TaxID=2962635 RepID=A0ABQ6M7J9_9STRA|nr:hypothetical protein TeGR_g3842 [Tetraparma gracilis]